MKNSADIDAPPRPAELPPARLLAEDHRRLDRSFEALIARAQGGDLAQLRAEWQVFERRLLDHFDLEEREILPGFARDNRRDAERIRQEHAAIRDALVELGMDLDLHLLRAEAVQSFCNRLRAHAAREEAALYRWAAANVPRGRWAALGRRLSGADNRRDH